MRGCYEAPGAFSGHAHGWSNWLGLFFWAEVLQRCAAEATIKSMSLHFRQPVERE
jgi:hypothetical protein